MEQNKDIIEGICEYAESKQIKELLSEYLRRLVIKQPEDPIMFLLDSISTDPFVVNKGDAAEAK
jgi:hypothetical protein